MKPKKWGINRVCVKASRTFGPRGLPKHGLYMLFLLGHGVGVCVWGGGGAPPGFGSPPGGGGGHTSHARASLTLVNGVDPPTIIFQSALNVGHGNDGLTRDGIKRTDSIKPPGSTPSTSEAHAQNVDTRRVDNTC